PTNRRRPRSPSPTNPRPSWTRLLLPSASNNSTWPSIPAPAAASPATSPCPPLRSTRRNSAAWKSSRSATSIPPRAPPPPSPSPTRPPPHAAPSPASCRSNTSSMRPAASATSPSSSRPTPNSPPPPSMSSARPVSPPPSKPAKTSRSACARPFPSVNPFQHHVTMRQRLTSLFLAAAVALPGLRVHAASVNPADSMWKDPDFIKSFTGSYGFLTGAEPKVSDKEIELLREVFDLIKVQPALAIQHLHKNAGTDASAAFDFVLGNLQFQAGALPEARRAYETAIKKFPNFRRAYKNLGLVLVQAGDFDAAIPVISKALELGEIDGR